MIKYFLPLYWSCKQGEFPNFHNIIKYNQNRIKNPRRVSGKGYGEISSTDKSPCYKLSETEHQKNRRTDFKLKF